MPELPNFIVGVDDINAARTTLQGAGLVMDEVADYGFIKTCDTLDPDGNRVSFVQVAE